MKVPSKNPPFFQGGCCRTFHEPLRFFEFPRSNALDTPYRWSDEDELQHGQLGFPTCIGYRHQDIYIYIICIYWVPSPISGKPSISHLPTQAKVRWATVGPWFAEGKLGGSSMGFTPVSLHLWSSPKFNSWPRKNDAWRTILTVLFGMIHFRGLC